ncbi:TonB-dependent receptor domain-containing protein [Phenylobacterium sp.]|uniref:TonB-dependent receptor domain-containing protein n=1 Tax=Phenylobacterium sp. TaxID=1871053 RepID=UPI002F95ADDC
MKINSMRERLLASTMMGSALALALAATPAFAQQADVEELVVTGSRIPQPNLVTTSPVTQVTGADIDTAGVTRVEDLVNQLPQAFAAQNSTVSNGSTGTATVDLRGLGATRTLVLVDGKRMPYGSPLQGGSAPDLNQIPGQLVERVEVLTGGASAVYGSDALSGVVNFIMRKNFEGVEVDLQHAFYMHHNDYDGPGNLRNVIAGRAATNPAQYKLPDDNVMDGKSWEYNLIMGVNAPDGKGNITAYVGYRNNDAILQANRDFSACSLGASFNNGGNDFTCGGSGTSFPGQFTPDFAAGNVFTIGGTAAAPTFVPYSTTANAYNFGPLNYFQRPDERYVLGMFGNYQISDTVEVYSQLMFMNYQTVAQIAPSGNFFNTSSINCGSPLLSAQQRTTIGCDAAEIAADASTPLFIGRRNVEGGGRQDDLEYITYRGVLGLRGNITEGWDYDISAQYAKVSLSRTYLNDFSVTRLGRALDVISVNGVPTCRSVTTGEDPNCVPYNIFQPGGVTSEALNYLQIPLVLRGHTVQTVVTAAVTGDLGTVGIQSPWSERAVQLAFGAEYRRDGLKTTPDTSFQTGEGAGQGGATLGVSGTTEVYDIFAEVQVPLIEDMPFARLVSLDAAYRWSDYQGRESTNTWKVGADWAPVEDVRFRGSFQKAVRAPNVIELFTGQGFNLFDMDDDPCGPTGTATLAQCVATGVPAAAFRSPALTSPAGQYNFLQGGNPDLNPEEGETTTFGVVFTPTFLPGFNFSVDYFKITVDGLVSTFGALNVLEACYQQNIQAQCARINRNNLGQLWVGEGHVEDLNTNIGGLQTSGVDVVANYGLELERFGLSDVGRLSFNFVGTWLKELVIDPGPLVDAYDCAGFYGNQCSDNAPPNPEWRHRFRVSWQSPWNLEVSGTWRHFSEVTIYQDPPTTNVRPDRTLEAQNYFDLAATWQVRDNARLRFGANNIFDRDPPLSSIVGTTGNGNTYPQTYDALGRYVFIGLTANF